MNLRLTSRSIGGAGRKCLVRGIVALTVAVCFTTVSLAASLVVLTVGSAASAPWEELTNHFEIVHEVQQRLRNDHDGRTARVPRRCVSVRTTGGCYTQCGFAPAPVPPHLVGSGIAMLC